jgi:anti-anti-sigma factor
VAVRRKEVRSITVLSLRGSFFGDKETDELQKAILDEAAAGNQRLILNLTECQALNSIAIGVLMRGFTNYKGRGGEIKVFDHHETEEQALASFA